MNLLRAGQETRLLCFIGIDMFSLFLPTVGGDDPGIANSRQAFGCAY